MKIEQFGPKKKLFNIIVGTHGDEGSPIKGFYMLKKYLEKENIKKGFNVIIADEEAVGSGKRFIDTDLNRSFPGNILGNHEEKLANKLVLETSKVKFNFDFHSTTVGSEPYGIISVYSKELYKVMKGLAVKNYLFDSSESLIKFSPGAVAFEVGKEGEPKSERNAFIIMKSILNYFNVTGNKTKIKICSPDIFLIYHFILKNKFLSINNKFKNFKYIKKGCVIGVSKDKEVIIANEGFYPILLEDKFSVKKAKRIKIEE